MVSVLFDYYGFKKTNTFENNCHCDFDAFGDMGGFSISPGSC